MTFPEEIWGSSAELPGGLGSGRVAAAESQWVPREISMIRIQGQVLHCLSVLEDNECIFSEERQVLSETVFEISQYCTYGVK